MVQYARSLILALAFSIGCAADVGAPRPLPPPLGLDVPASIAATTVAVFLTDSACSGVVIDAHTLFTAKHCLRGGDSLPYAAASGAVGIRVLDPTTVVLVDGLDIIFVSLAEGEPPFDVLADQGVRPAYGAGAWIAGYGCSGFKRLDVRPMRYVGAEDHHALTTYHELDDYRGSACHGDSGGGVFDGSGRLVGITSSIGTGLGNGGHVYAVPVYEQHLD